MTERGSVDCGSTIITYEVVRSARRKKTIQISLQSSRGVVVSAPMGVSVREIEGLLRRRSDWVVQRSAELAERTPLRFVNGETVPYLGQPIPVEEVETKRPGVELTDGVFRVGTPAGLSGDERLEAVSAVFIGWFYKQAERHINEEVNRWAPIADRSPTRILIRNQKRRWGSCAPDGTLRFNWRLMMLESRLIDLVVVHELAHLRVRGHSPEFWAIVGAALPDYQDRRHALRTAGEVLPL